MDRLAHYTQLDVYHGTAEELVKARLVMGSQLPAHPGALGDGGMVRSLTGAFFYRHGQRVGYVRRIDTQPDAEHWMRIECLSDGRYAVSKGLPREDRLRRRRESAEQCRQEAERYSAQHAQRARDEIAQTRSFYSGLPVPRFRESLADQFRKALLTLSAHVDGAVHDPSKRVLPHLVPFATFEAVMPHVFTIVEILESSEVLEGGGVIAAARDDPAFQKFLIGQCLREDGD